VDDLKTWHTTTAPEMNLENLSPEAGAAVLYQAGAQRAGAAEIKPDDQELKDASEEVKGHALTLQLLGSYLARAHRGDIRKRARVKFDKADERVQGGHAFRVMAAYETWLGQGGAEGTRQLAVLRLLGLFDRPADPGCLAALRQPPAIPGLTEPLLSLDEEEWNLVVTGLEAAGLVETAPWEPKRVKGFGEEKARKRMDVMKRNIAIPLGEPEDFTPPQKFPAGSALALDAHPLLRQYFGKQLRETEAKAWQEGHRRLYEHLKASLPYWPEGAEGLQPLYQAVAHGCLAGMHQRACEDVYHDRIQRRREAYSIRNLGLFGSELGAVACFFEQPWSRPAPALSEAGQAWLLSQAAFCLRALGRLSEALEPFRASRDMCVEQEDWTNAAIRASNLNELELMLGDVPGAVRDGAQSIEYADRGGDAFERLYIRTTHADALHQAGQRAEALALFREAESMQAEWQPYYPLLYSFQGFRYCDLLLDESERGASC
jgi:hypothetical protein